MKLLCHILGAALFISLALPGNVSANSVFSALLKEGGIDWQLPEGFAEVPILDNDQMPYEMAVRSLDNSMEIRYAIRPLNRIEIDYDDPHGATPDPNHIFPLIFQALTGKLSKGGSSPSREFRKEDAELRFGADWAAMAVFDVEPAFAPEYAGALMLAMHRNRQADAYVIYLFNDYQTAKARINANLETLVFQAKNIATNPPLSQTGHE